MKKFLIMLITSFSALLSISNLTSSINNTQSERITNSENANKIDFVKDSTIGELDAFYQKRSTNLNKEIKNNLISSIKLDNNTIIINYKNLNKNLFDSNTYKFLQSKEYLNSLEMQYQLHQIQFDGNNNIVFGDDIHLLKFDGIWFESHWYWFGYWRLHFDSNRCHQLLDMIGSATRIASGGAAISTLASLLSNWVAGAIAAVIAAFVIGIQWTLISYDKGRGVWFALWTLIPTNVGSN